MKRIRRVRQNKRRGGQGASSAAGLPMLEALVRGGRAAARRLVPLLLLLLVAAGLPTLIYKGYIHTVSSPSFAIKTLQFHGTRHASERELALQSQLAPGINIFSVKAPALEARLRAHPWVKSASVVRTLPDTITMTVTEHVPAAIVATPEGFVLVDEQGVQFKVLGPGDPHAELFALLPLVTGIASQEVATPQAASRGPLPQALKLWQMMSDPEVVGPEVGDPSEVHWDPVLGFSVIVGEQGTEIRLGQGRMPQRLAHLKRVYEKLSQSDTAVDYVLIDQDGDLDRVAVGPRPNHR